MDDSTYEMRGDHTGNAPPMLRHRLIRASAGSGKTYQLAHRFAGLLLLGAEPASILATTFTRKAAGEIRQRVLELIAEAALHEKAAAEANKGIARTGLPGLAGADRAAYGRVLRKLLDQLDRLQITTLDGFFNQVITGFQIELGLPADPVLTDDGSAAAGRLRTDAIESLLERQAQSAGLAGGREEALTTLMALLRGVQQGDPSAGAEGGGRSIHGAIQSVIGGTGGLLEAYRQAPRREQWGSLLDLSGLPAPLAPTDVAMFREGWAGLGEELPIAKTTGNVRKHWLNGHRRLLELLNSEDWEAFSQDNMAGKLCNEQRFDSVDTPEAFLGHAQPLLQHAQASVLRSRDVQAQATWAMLHGFNAEFEAACRAAGVVLFADLTTLLLRAVRGELVALPGASEAGDDFDFALAFAERMDQKLNHVLLDEFQDTAVSQYEVLWPLMAELVGDVEGSRSLFAVGDPKQSIYGWRGGRRELFDRVEREVRQAADGVDVADAVGLAADPEDAADGDGTDSALETPTLSESFRSSPVVLEAVNRVFASIAERDLNEAWSAPTFEFQRGYKTHVAGGENAALSGHVRVEEVAGASDDADGEAGDEAEPLSKGDAVLARTAEVAAALHGDLAPRGLNVAVLTRSNRDGLRLLHALRQRGVPVELEGGSCPADHPAAAAVLAALRLCDHPGDTAAAFEVMHGPLGEVVGLTPGMDLQFGLGTALERWASDTRMRLVARGLPALLSAWTRGLMELRDRDGVCPLGAEGWRRLGQVRALAMTHVVGLPLRATAFVEHVEATRIAEASAGSRAGAGAVSVMTIHKAKGLEFDAVVMPLQTPAQELNFRASILEHRPAGAAHGLDTVYRSPPKAVRDAIPQVAAMHAAAEERDIYERLCNLYVAMTRSKRALHIIAPEGAGRGKSRSKDKPGAWSKSSVAAVMSAFETAAPQPDGEVQVWSESGEADWFREVPVREPAADGGGLFGGEVVGEKRTADPAEGWALTEGSGRVPRVVSATVTGTSPAAKTVRGVELFAESSVRAMSDGDVTHRLCEVIGWINEVFPDEDDLMAIAPTRPALVRQLREQVRQPAVFEALSRRGAAGRWCEKRFARMTPEGRLVRGIIDRVVWWSDAGEDGPPTHAEVLDFKTDKVSAEQAQAKGAADYADQMALYRDAAASLLKLDPARVKPRLVWLEPGVVVDL